MKKKLLLGIIAILSIVSLVAACSTEDVAEVAVEEVAVEEVVADMPEEDVDEPVVAEDGTYSYYVNFLNYDGSVLQRSVYEEGKTPKYTGKTPTYSDGAYIYTFTGWDKKLTKVAGTQTYKAVYTRVAIAKKESKQVVKDTCAEVYGVAYAWEANGWYKIDIFENGQASVRAGNSTHTKPTGYDGEGWYHVDNNWNIIEKCNKTSDLEAKKAHDLIDYPEAVEDLVYDGTEQNLVYAGEGVTFNYSVEHEGMVSETGEVVPFAVDAGDYIVRYSIDGGTTWSEGINVSIAKKDITIASTTDSKTYDGTPLVRAGAGDAYVANGSLGTGDTFSVTMDSSITNVGSVTNEIDDLVFFDIDGNNISYNYNATKQEGTLTITKRPLTITSGTDIENTGSQTAQNSAWMISSGSLVSGHTAVVSITGIQNGVGSSDNTFTYIIRDENGVDVTNNYDVTCNYGTLTVEEASALCSNHSTHYKVTSIEPGKLNTMVNIQIYTWNGSAFVNSGSTFTNAIYFLTTPEIGSYYAEDSGYIVKCTNNHE